MDHGHFRNCPFFVHKITCGENKNRFKKELKLDIGILKNRMSLLDQKAQSYIYRILFTHLLGSKKILKLNFPLKWGVCQFLCKSFVKRVCDQNFEGPKHHSKNFFQNRFFFDPNYFRPFFKYFSRKRLWGFHFKGLIQNILENLFSM